MNNKIKLHILGVWPNVHEYIKQLAYKRINYNVKPVSGKNPKSS